MNSEKERITAEQATGCAASQRDGGQLYLTGGKPVSDAEARQAFRQGKCVHAPNAGAGSYRDVLERMGLSPIQVEDWTSSAGDWYFRVKGGLLVFQENRYPFHGFKYSMEIGSEEGDLG